MHLHTPRLLITDDDRDLRETMAGALQSRGFAILEAANGEEALELVSRHEVHLLLLDMHMPRLSGLETIRKLKALELPVEFPWILMSAALDERIVAEARAAAAHAVLAKPLSLPELTGVVNRALEQAFDWRAG